MAADYFVDVLFLSFVRFVIALPPHNYFVELIHALDLEKQILQWVGRVVREALLSHDDTIDIISDLGDTEITRPESATQKLSYAVVGAWAQMFKRCNSPWPIVQLIGQSLDRYAELIQPPSHAG